MLSLKSYLNQVNVAQKLVESQLASNLDPLENYLKQMNCVRKFGLFEEDSHSNLDLKRAQSKLLFKINQSLSEKCNEICSSLDELESCLCVMDDEKNRVAEYALSSGNQEASFSLAAMSNINKSLWKNFHKIKSELMKLRRDESVIENLRLVVNNDLKMDLMRLQVELEICRQYS